MSTLEGKNVLITGATRGIGRAIAERIARDRARLALSGRDRRALDEVADAVRRAGAPAPLARAFDLAVPREVLEFVGLVR